MGCDEISLAGSPRASPYAQGHGPCIFCGPQDRGDLPPTAGELRSLHDFEKKALSLWTTLFYYKL